MNENLTNISSTPDFVPFSFKWGIGTPTFIEGYFFVILLIFLFSRFSSNYSLILKITNWIYLSVLLYGMILNVLDLLNIYFNYKEHFVLVKESYVLVFSYLGLLLLIKKIRTNITYSFILGCVSSLIPLVVFYWNSFLLDKGYLPVSSRNLYPFLWDMIEAGILFSIIVITVYTFIKTYNTLKIRLSQHS